jgi:hypothetical protein
VTFWLAALAAARQCQNRVGTAEKEDTGINGVFGRGSWIRTNDLQYPKLPRYQAALYPDHLGNVVDTRLKRCQQG